MSKLSSYTILLCFLWMWSFSDAVNIGCYMDQATRGLPYGQISSDSMTLQICIQHCELLGYPYAGAQSHSQCFCGLTAPPNNPNYQKVSSSECNTPCSGNKNQMCGGSWRNTIFSSPIPPMTSPVSVGCYDDAGGLFATRGLPYALISFSSMTQQFCINHCKIRGYLYAGAQSHSQCFCGLTLPQYKKLPSTECNTQCSGNKNQMCGGLWKNTVFATSDTNKPMSAKVGCYVDHSTRGLPYATIDSNAMTIQMCVSHCDLLGYQYAGVQSKTQCYCGMKLPPYQKVSFSECNSPCAGNANEKCGGSWRNTVYSIASSPMPAPVSKGCYVDQGNRGLPFGQISSNSMTQQMCISHCKMLGFAYAGVQAGNECFCGLTLPPYDKVASSQCNNPCSGDKDQSCGGGWRNNVFSTTD